MLLLLRLFLATQLWAIDLVTSSIDQAQSLAKKKNRVEACGILYRAWTEAPPTGKGRTKLADVLGQISKMFFTDKGQKTFEAAAAAMWDTPDLALNQFKEALALEDKNLQILDHIARVQIAKQDCDGALTTLATARELNPLDGESAVLELRAFSCKQNFESLREKAKSLPPLNKWEEAYVQYLLAGDSLQQKSYKRAFDVLLKISEEQPQFPESYILLGRAASEINKDPEPFLQKYISLCKAVGPREKKKFALEPRLCLSLKEAEDEMAKKQTL